MLIPIDTEIPGCTGDCQQGRGECDCGCHPMSTRETIEVWCWIMAPLAVVILAYLVLV